MIAAAAPQPVLLLVDDEDNIRKALQRALRGAGYRILTAGSGAEALELLTREPVQVILSDQRMPEMTGAEFLGRVKELYPDTVRIVLSGYTDLSTITDAINRGAIYKFLTKPWDDALLRENIAEAFRHFALRRENERLAAELKTANAELSSINRELEQRVEQKTRQALLNLRALQVSQEILENLPVAVLGVDSEGCIAVANRAAHALLGECDELLVGRALAQVLPPELRAALARLDDGAAADMPLVALGDKGTVALSARPLGQNSDAQGTILVLALR
jgi:FixJ family two-component response regulator